MSLFLQIGVRGVIVAEQWITRHDLEGQCVKGPGTGHRLLVLEHRAALGREEVVVAIEFVQMRPLDGFDIRAAPNGPCGLGHQTHPLRIELGEGDAIEGMMILAKVPGLLNQILPAVIIMEQARIEAHTVHTDRLRPGAVDIIRSDQVIGTVLERAVDHLSHPHTRARTCHPHRKDPEPTHLLTRGPPAYRAGRPYSTGPAAASNGPGPAIHGV